MSDEAAFLRALRERPDDETARLVYTDWLDDRSDPRAEYLRAEAAWVALRPSDEQYRPLYRRVSRLAAGLEPEWFATVSRASSSARKVWEQVAHRWQPHRQERTTEPVSEWLAAVEGLGRVFDEYVGTQTTQRRFCVPFDYAALMMTVGGGWESRDGEYEKHELPTAHTVREWNSNQWGRCGRTERLEIWVLVAANDAYDVERALCCDLDSPRFGEVATIPYGHSYPFLLVAAHFSDLMPTSGDTFLHFLSRWLSRE